MDGDGPVALEGAAGRLLLGDLALGDVEAEDVVALVECEPEPPRMLVASSTVLPVRSGTSIGFGPRLRTTETGWPRFIGVPATGSLETTLPSGTVSS